MYNPDDHHEYDPETEALLRAADAALGNDPPKPGEDPFEMELPPEVYGAPEPPAAPVTVPLRTPGPSVVAYNADRVQPRYTQPEPSRVRMSPGVPAEPTTPAYDQAPLPEKPTKKTRKEKKRRRRRRKWVLSLLLLLALVLTPVIWFFTYIEQPRFEVEGRRADCSTVLICGTDAGGSLTDTMMLFSVNIPEKRMSLVSLPRDTVTRTARGNLAKLNAAYARNGSGEEGMEGLMDFVEEMIGFRPDGYMLIDLNCFVELVDLMGGVEFNVPMDMYYSDPEQGLYIDLTAGWQRLNGNEAMGLVRYRKGYALQDLERVNVQRQVLAACMDQWMRVGNVFKVGKALDILKANTITNLTDRHLLWLAQGALRCGKGNLEAATLPGEGKYIDDVSFYVLDREAVCDLVNQLLNPYQRQVRPEDLKIID